MDIHVKVQETKAELIIKLLERDRCKSIYNIGMGNSLSHKVIISIPIQAIMSKLHPVCLLKVPNP